MINVFLSMVPLASLGLVLSSGALIALRNYLAELGLAPYRVRYGFAQGGVLIFEIEKLTAEVCALIIGGIQHALPTPAIYEL
jgi:hypothetical protein